MSEAMTQLHEKEDRRQHLRVHDAIGLRIQRITDLPAAGQSVEVTSRKSEDKYDIEGYADVRRHFPAVTRYIDELEEQIRQLKLDSPSTIERPSHKVILSAGGILFSDDILLHPGEMVQLTLTLFPSALSISTDAEILSCNDAPEVAQTDKPSYRAMFVRLKDEDKHLLNRHVQNLHNNIRSFHE